MLCAAFAYQFDYEIQSAIRSWISDELMQTITTM